MVTETARVLAKRVSERFPGSGLSRVSEELADLSGGADELSRDLARPRVWLRLLLTSVVLAASVASFFAVRAAPVRLDFGGISDFVQGVQSLMQCLVYVAGSVWFLASVESRYKRTRVLGELHSLRDTAHVVDMHQLSKDPHSLCSVGSDTASSPSRLLAPYELGRYLDYCSEMLAIVAKLAAVYVQRMPDPVCIEVASDVEKLCLGLSQKVWQKIRILADQGRKSGAPADTGD